MKARVEEALAKAESEGIDPDIVDRLDNLLVTLAAASRDVCTNERCPNYNKKCKMR